MTMNRDFMLFLSFSEIPLHKRKNHEGACVEQLQGNRPLDPEHCQHSVLYLPFRLDPGINVSGVLRLAAVCGT
jgi:hypothetical protein